MALALSKVQRLRYATISIYRLSTAIGTVTAKCSTGQLSYTNWLRHTPTLTLINS